MDTIISSSYSPAIAAVFGFLMMVGLVLIINVDGYRRDAFEKQVRKGIIKNNLTYEDMQHIAERWGRDRNTVLQTLRIIHSEAISSDDEDLCQSIDIIRELIKEHQKQEPYSELPENISLQLNGLSAEINNNNKVSELASSLNELYSTNQKKFSKQVKLTYWSAAIGVAGFFIGAIGLYFAVINKA